MQGHWGFNKLTEYNEEYFLESGRNLDSLCPFEKPKIECPHITKGSPKRYIWNVKPAFYLNESYVHFAFPEEISIKDSSKTVYWYSGIETARKIIKDKAALVTNYIPILVKNFRIDGKQNKFLELLLPEIMKIGRSIILDTAGVKIPVEDFVIHSNWIDLSKEIEDEETIV